MAKVLIIGASHGIGFETVRAALRAGHSVRALARSAASIPIQDANLDKVSGNALDPDTIRNALRDIDVVIQTLGVDFSPRLIFEGTRLFSDSTRILVDAMKTAGVKRLIAVTGLGAGDSRGRGGLLYDAIVFPLLLKRARSISSQLGFGVITYSASNRRSSPRTLRAVSAPYIVADIVAERADDGADLVGIGRA